MNAFLRTVAASVAMSVFGFAASAATVVDFSPETTGITNLFNAGNRDDAQNWGTLFTLSEEFNLSAIDRYGEAGTGAVGDDVIVKIWTSDGATLLHDISTTITIQDTDGAGTTDSIRSRAVFDVDLAAGDYLIGLAGDGAELSQRLLQGTSGSTFRFFGDGSPVAEITASIRVFGDTPVAVPLPAGLPLMIGALAVFGIVTRRRAA